MTAMACSWPPATGQALATWITTSQLPQEVASFRLSRFDQPR
jgi:hypothetical protein